MGSTITTCGRRLRDILIVFSRGRNRPNSRFKSPPNLSSSSISRPPRRLASQCHHLSLPALTKLSNSDPFAALHESAYGPKRTSGTAPHMCSFGGKADMPLCTVYVCFDPKRTFGPSIDTLDNGP